MSFIPPPARLPFLPRVLLRMVERRMGKPLEANRLLSWYPRAFFGSGIMEALVAHDEAEVPLRLLALVRIYTSFLVSCPFCIDLNARELSRKGITEQEIRALRGLVPLEEVPTFSPAERAALAYIHGMCQTPIEIREHAVDEMKRFFSPRGFVIVTSTCAQVNFWTRQIQALGVAPAGFSESCSILDLDAYRTLKR